MKSVLCILFCLALVLCGCATPPAETTAPTTQPVLAETTVPTTTVPETTVPETTAEPTQAPALPAEDAYFPNTLLSTEPYTEPEDPAERLAYRRDLVEAEMRRMMSMLWTPAEDIVYTHSSKPVTLKAGRIYQGMPYAHGSGSGFGFLTFATAQDANGVYTLSNLEGKRLSGGPNLARVSNNCADAVFWAWARVANSIKFKQTNVMTPDTGCLKVGDYVCDQKVYINATKRVTEQNGTDVMFASYAQLQKGDAMVMYTDKSGGHAVMVCGVHVEKTADGKIDGDKSYVVILEQISSNLTAENHYYNETVGAEVYTCGGVDTQWSFNTIYGKGYLPLTCKELIDPTPLETETVSDTITEYSAKTVYDGNISSNYRVSSVTVTITDADGNVVRRSIGYAPENNMMLFRMQDFTTQVKQINGSASLDGLLPGTYHCTTTCTISTGRTFTVRDFDFTI